MLNKRTGNGQRQQHQRVKHAAHKFNWNDYNRIDIRLWACGRYGQVNYDDSKLNK